MQIETRFQDLIKVLSVNLDFNEIRKIAMDESKLRQSSP
jgi:hypothetical protein